MRPRAGAGDQDRDGEPDEAAATAHAKFMPLAAGGRSFAEVGFDAPILWTVGIGDAGLRLSEAFRRQERLIDPFRGEVGDYGVGAAFGEAQIVFFGPDRVRVPVNLEFGPGEPWVFDRLGETDPDFSRAACVSWSELNSKVARRSN